MAFNFIDGITRLDTASFNLLELDENKVKGIGYYAALTDVFDQKDPQRCQGFIAVVSDGTGSSIYQYTGDQLTGTSTEAGPWSNEANWQQVVGPSNGTPDVTGLYRNLSHSGTCELFGALDVTNGVSGRDFTESSEAFWVPGIGLNDIPTDVSGGTYPVSVNYGLFSARWTALQFSGVDQTTAITSGRAAFRTSIGLDYYCGASFELNGTDLDEVVSVNWIAGSAAANYLNDIPEEYRSQIFMLYMGTDTATNHNVFIAPFHETIAGTYTDANWGDASANWKVVSTPTKAPVSARLVYLDGSNQPTANAFIPNLTVQSSVVTTVNVQAFDTNNNAPATIADLSDLRLEVQLSTPMKDYLQTIISGVNAVARPKLDYKVDIELIL